jgi:hypothetical protein
LIFSGANAMRMKNLNYYSHLKKSAEGCSKHFERIIRMDVKRTKAAVDDPILFDKLMNVLVNFAK